VVEGAEGFDDAFPALFARAYRVAFRILGHSGEAEDVASEALARALKSWRRVGSLPHRDAWVLRVATNLAIDVTRRRRRWVDGLALVDGVGEADDADLRLALREVLRSLPRRQRDVLALRYLADLSEVEVAALLGISHGSVKRHVSRGLAKLRRLGGTEGVIPAV
jgi:RNA polymerase sigma factor (sigma-70 family)